MRVDVFATDCSHEQKWFECFMRFTKTGWCCFASMVKLVYEILTMFFKIVIF